MKKFIIGGIKSILILTIIAVICNYCYIWANLNKLFSTDITFIQWYAISIITNLLIPSKDLFNSTDKNDK